jgi:hypothetical protein
MDGTADKATPRLNRLVDWLDGLDTEELRPRRLVTCQQAHRPALLRIHSPPTGCWREVAGAAYPRPMRSIFEAFYQHVQDWLSILNTAGKEQEQSSLY